MIFDPARFLGFHLRVSRLTKFHAAGLALIFTISAYGQEPRLSPSAQNNAAPVPVLHVVVRDVEPFCFEQEGRRVGYSIELWDNIARETGLRYDVRTVDSAQAMVDALAARQADVGIGALSITSQRQQVIDFSYPFYESGLDILTSNKGNSSIFHFIRLLFNLQLLEVMGLLLLAVLFVSHLLWLFERRDNGEEFPKDYLRGIFESLWWTATIMITLGCENKTPRGVSGRILALVWMISGVLLVSFMTASFSSSLTVNSLEGTINGPNDLGVHRIATVAGSTAERYLRMHKVRSESFADASTACEAVSNGTLEAAVYDAPILRYELIKLDNKNLRVTGNLFEKQGYGIGLQQDSPYRGQINTVLLKLFEDHAIADLDRKWFGTESTDKAAEK